MERCSQLRKFSKVSHWTMNYIFLGSLTNIAATIWKLPESTQGLLMGIFCIGSGYGLAKCLKASSPRQRVICFAPLFISRVLSILFRLTPWGGGEWSILSHVILQVTLHRHEYYLIMHTINFLIGIF